MTNKEISELSDFELNEKIASLLGKNEEMDFILSKDWEVYQQGNISVALCNNPKQTYNCFPDYCNIWNDLMPLIFEHKIRLTPFPGETYQAAKYAPKICIEVTNANPARALAECLLMVLIEKGNK